MKFSVIIPTLGREYLLQAVCAVLDQTHKDFEVIVVNDGPERIIEDPRVVCLRGDGTGITGAMNKGMLFATGDVFCEANDDDMLLPTALETVQESLGESMWCYGKISRGGKEYGEPWDFERLKRGNYIPQPSVFWTRKAYDSVGPMDTENDLVSDYEYWLRLGSRFEPKFIDEPLAWYREWDGQLTNTMSVEQSRQAEIVRKKYA